MDAPTSSFGNREFEVQFLAQLAKFCHPNKPRIAYIEKFSMIMETFNNIETLMYMDHYHIERHLEIQYCINVCDTSVESMDIAIKTTIKYIDKCWIKNVKNQQAAENAFKNCPGSNRRTS